MKHTLGVDIGTFESKGVLVDETGRIVARAARPHRMLVPEPGWAEHRPEEDWWGDFVHVTRALLAESRVDPKSIRATAVSAIGPCLLPVDGDGAPLTNAILYGVDTRARAEIAALNERIGADTIFEQCGNPLTTQSIGPKILWVREHRPDVYRRAEKFLTATSFLVHRLTGRFVIDRYSAANWGPLYDVGETAWRFDLAPDLARPDQLPDLLWTAEIAGTVTARAAAETGLAVGTPVTAGTIDAAAEALSVGVSEPGDAMIMLGSTVLTMVLTPARPPDRRLWCAPWLFPGGFATLAGSATSGTLTHWFRDRFARELAADEAFARLAEEASLSPPGARGLVVLPYFSGERAPIHDPTARGLVFGLDLTHGRGDLYRAVLEGIAAGTAHTVSTYREAGVAPGRVFAVGGGTKNAIWLQATADLTGQTLALRQESVGASLGDAFLAALAVGDARPGDIARWNPEERGIRPDPANAGVYERQYEIFRALYERNKDLMALSAARG